ncbi:MAG: hypothetical protein QXS54_02440, partial [Candidatus Methanomethylicaceae archaeon]
MSLRRSEIAIGVHEPTGGTCGCDRAAACPNESSTTNSNADPYSFKPGNIQIFLLRTNRGRTIVIRREIRPNSLNHGGGGGVGVGVGCCGGVGVGVGCCGGV